MLKEEAILGMRSFSKNLAMGQVTKAKSTAIVKGSTMEEVIFSTAANRKTVIIPRRVIITGPELKLLNSLFIQIPYKQKLWVQNVINYMGRITIAKKAGVNKQALGNGIGDNRDPIRPPKVITALEILEIYGA